MTTPKYRTDSQACSCPGFWYRRTCKHYRAYCDAVALVRAQDAFNQTIGANLAPMGETQSPTHAMFAGVGG